MRVTELRARLERTLWDIGDADVTKAIEDFNARCEAERPDLKANFEDGIDARDLRFPMWVEIDDSTPARGVQFRIGYDINASRDTAIALLAAAYDVMTDQKEEPRFPADAKTQFLAMKLCVSRLKTVVGFREAISTFAEHLSTLPFGLSISGDAISRNDVNAQIELKEGTKTRRMLDALIDAVPGGLTRQELTEVAWGEETTAFDEALGRLRREIDRLHLKIVSRRRKGSGRAGAYTLATR